MDCIQLFVPFQKITTNSTTIEIFGSNMRFAQRLTGLRHGFAHGSHKV